MISFSKFFKKKDTVVLVEEARLSFSEWYRLAQETVDKGSYHNLDMRLWESFPDDYSSESDQLLADVMGKLETGFLKDSMTRFTNRWNRGIENADITEMRIAWSDITMSTQKAWSLIDRKRFPENLSSELDKQLTEIIGNIQNSIEKTTKKAADETLSPILKDAYYMVVKQRLSNIWSTENV